MRITGTPAFLLFHIACADDQRDTVDDGLGITGRVLNLLRNRPRPLLDPPSARSRTDISTPVEPSANEKYKAGVQVVGENGEIRHKFVTTNGESVTFDAKRREAPEFLPAPAILAPWPYAPAALWPVQPISISFFAAEDHPAAAPIAGQPLSGFVPLGSPRQQLESIDQPGLEQVELQSTGSPAEGTPPTDVAVVPTPPAASETLATTAAPVTTTTTISVPQRSDPEPEVEEPGVARTSFLPVRWSRPEAEHSRAIVEPEPAEHDNMVEKLMEARAAAEAALAKMQARLAVYELMEKEAARKPPPLSEALGADALIESIVKDMFKPMGYLSAARGGF